MNNKEIRQHAKSNWQCDIHVTAWR